MAGVYSDDPVASEAVSLILMGLLTFLVILLSYRWLQNRIGSRKNTATTTEKKVRILTRVDYITIWTNPQIEDDFSLCSCSLFS